MTFIKAYEAFFGIDNLTRYNETVIGNLTIPVEAKRFLIDVGLPQKYYPEPFISFRPLPDVPLLGSAFSASYSLPYESLAYRVFCTQAFDDSESDEVLQFYCLDEQLDGRVIKLRRSYGEHWAVNLLNSSISQFAEFILAIHQFKRWIQRRYNETERSSRSFLCSEVEARYRLLMQRMHRIDSKLFAELSMEESDSSWENYIEQLIVYSGCKGSADISGEK